MRYIFSSLWVVKVRWRKIKQLSCLAVGFLKNGEQLKGLLIFSPVANGNTKTFSHFGGIQILKYILHTIKLKIYEHEKYISIFWYLPRKVWVCENYYLQKFNLCSLNSDSSALHSFFRRTWKYLIYDFNHQLFLSLYPMFLKIFITVRTQILGLISQCVCI